MNFVHRRAADVVHLHFFTCTSVSTDRLSMLSSTLRARIKEGAQAQLKRQSQRKQSNMLHMKVWQRSCCAWKRRG